VERAAIGRDGHPEQLDKGGRLSTDRRYHLSSLDKDASEAVRAVRSHRHIENRLHWVLDVVFREDESRVRKDNGAQNLAVMRHAALNILRQDKHSKLSVNGKTKKCGYDKRLSRIGLFDR
jgi:predicted transposase YbfD/YdcC